VDWIFRCFYVRIFHNGTRNVSYYSIPLCRHQFYSSCIVLWYQKITLHCFITVFIVTSLVMQMAYVMLSAPCHTFRPVLQVSCLLKVSYGGCGNRLKLYTAVVQYICQNGKRNGLPFSMEGELFMSRNVHTVH
jgi:hypothetical protein